MDEGAGEEAPRRRIGKGWRIGLISAALVSVRLSLVSAAWIAAQPPGRLIVVARHGIVQQVAAGSGCEAKRMQADPQNDYVENTLPAIYKAAKLGADAIEIDVQATADGQAVAFRDADLSCRTNGTGPLSAHSLADLKRLDVGYGYTGDGGHSYPLRGRGVGGMPTGARSPEHPDRLPLRRPRPCRRRRARGGAEARRGDGRGAVRLRGRRSGHRAG